MTKSVGVHEAKTNLSRLLQDVLAGQEVLITRRGQEIAALVPRGARTRVFGVDEGRFTVPDDFDAPLPDRLLQEFER
ncbi:MAG: type II toxin-antitoxin system Phd/YefM family antitoxin [Solirubrobacteraceae bacterium]